MFLRFDELKPKKGIPFSRPHLWRLEKNGKFPRAIQLGGNTRAYDEAEIDEWIAARKAERDGGTAS